LFLRIAELTEVEESHRKMNGKIQERLAEVEEDNKKLALKIDYLNYNKVFSTNDVYQRFNEEMYSEKFLNFFEKASLISFSFLKYRNI